MYYYTFTVYNILSVSSLRTPIRERKRCNLQPHGYYNNNITIHLKTRKYTVRTRDDNDKSETRRVSTNFVDVDYCSRVTFNIA